MTVARILAGLGVLLALLSLLAGYIRFQGLDTETVKGTAGELIADDEVRDQVAASLVDALYANIDVTAALEQKLPPDQKGLAGPRRRVCASSPSGPPVECSSARACRPSG